PLKPGVTEPPDQLSRIGGPVHDARRCRNCTWPGSGHRPARRTKWRQIVVELAFSVLASSNGEAGDLVLCKPERLCYTLPAREPLFRLFLGSSAVEHSTVNRMVAGSNPARGASYGLSTLRPLRLIVQSQPTHACGQPL